MISICNLTKQYNGKKVLKNVNYEFKENTCYLLKGSSGIGKSTLLNIIGGYLQADSGFVKISENSTIEYMFQEELLFSNLTVLENIAVKYYATHKDDVWNLDQIKETSALLADTFDLTCFLDRKVSSLSGGERQRVVLATMALSGADIYLMDEPVTNLDEENRDIICTLINELSKERTVIIVSHIDLPRLNNVIHLNLIGGELVEV